ncbi:hypothetical protein FBY35_2751 [Streptomyces sp. SLBN-118]|uniref:hypothetical protein n=1 Tax=Streptomyces sp. SLBN-118 TaxID=2768454 RepID=UPI00114E05B8|nr:hypothetical protein [Streptomyces sp. SLBN-118]TQK52320.1 hypothetical protein FBY35_2751 [Streptomyces sp. SLBN-118]
MEWVDRLVAATCWSTEPGKLDWSSTERVLGTPLPADFKELRRRFPEWGAFSDHVLVLEAQGDTESVLANHESLLRSVRGNPDNRRMFEPFGILGASDESDGKGLVQWGYSLIEEEYYWLVDTSVDSSTWPVVARVDPLEPFQRLDMTASEFVYRVLTESEFSPFGVAATIETPYYRAF